MGTPHKHRDVIIAWANGEEIEGKWQKEWALVDTIYAPQFDPDREYRIKPKRVKKEGWVNVYTDTYVTIFPTKEQADDRASRGRKTCIRIEWEEEE